MGVERARTPRIWGRLVAVVVLSACGRTEIFPADIEVAGADARPSDARDAPSGDAPSDGRGDVPTTADASVDRAFDAVADRMSNACGMCAPGQTCQPTANPFSNPSIWLGGVRGAFPAAAAQVGLADMNQDGRNDVVFSTGGGTENVGVCLGHGDGTFEPPVYSGVSPQGTVQLAIADLDLDGRLDVAGTSMLGVNIELGNGDGTFRPNGAFVESDGTTNVVVGDLDGDGQPDMATPNILTNAVYLYFARGAGEFGPPRFFPAGTHPVGVALADFDRDGRPDLAVVNTASGDVSVLLHPGYGDFSGTTSLPIGKLADAIAAGDFDGDGRIDLAVALQKPAPDNLVLLFGHGDGTFDPPLAFDAMKAPTRLAVGDMNGDGVDDVVCSSSIQRSSSIGILFGSRARSFDGVHSFATGDLPAGLALGDIDGDGHLDVATADTGAGSYPNGVGIVFGGGGHGALFAPWMWPVGAGPNAIAEGDLDGDGRPDLVTANSMDFSVSVLLADGRGGLRPGQRYDVANYPSLSLVLTDVDNDGKLDIVAAGNQRVSVLRGNGDGTFRSAQVTMIASPLVAIDAGDVNGDGLVDLVAGGSTPGSLWLLLGHGDGTFAAPANIGHRDVSSLSVQIARLDPGGAAALVVAGRIGSSQNSLAVLGGNGDGTFQAPQTVDLGGDGQGLGTRWYTALADFDRDGRVDVAVAGPGGQLVVLMGTGGGGFSAPRALDFGSGGAASVLATDVDRDGLVDLVVATLPSDPLTPGPHDIAFLRGRGNGTFDPPQRAAIGSSPAALAMIDLDQDGRVDVAAAASGSDSVNVIFNRETFQCR